MKLALKVGNFADYTLEGSKLNEMARAFEKEVQEEYQKMKEVGEKIQNENFSDEEKKQAREDYKVINQQIITKNLEFVKNHTISEGVILGRSPALFEFAYRKSVG